MFTSFKNIPKVKCFDIDDERMIENLQPAASDYLAGSKKRNKSQGRLGSKTNRDKFKPKV